MSYLNILALIIFIIPCGFFIFKNVIYKNHFFKNKKDHANLVLLILSLTAGALVIFYKIPWIIFQVSEAGGFIPFKDIGATDDQISRLLMLDICNFFSIISFIFFPIMYWKDKCNVDKSFMKYVAPIGLLGSLLTMFATVSEYPIVHNQYAQNVSLNDFTNFIVFLTIGFESKPLFFFEHFSMGVICIGVLANQYYYSLKSYFKIYLTIGVYVLYVVIMMLSLGINQSVSALGKYDFFNNNNSAYYLDPQYKIMLEIYGVNSYPLAILCSWFSFLLLANIIVLSKNYAYSYSKTKSFKKAWIIFKWKNNLNVYQNKTIEKENFLENE